MFTFLKVHIINHKKIIGSLIIVIFLVILYSRGALGNTSAEGVYKTEVAAKRDLTTTINASGNIEAENKATMGFLSSGRVAQLNFKEGDEVKQGQIIASLDSTEGSLAVAKAEETLKNAQAALDKVIDDIHLYQYGNGGFSNVGSANETQAQKTDREKAEATVNVAYDDLRKSQKQLEWYTIVAPFDGIISDIIGMSVGQNTSVASSQVTLVGKGGLKFVANVDEMEFGSLQVGQTGEVILDAFSNDKFIGTITKIAGFATKLSTGGSAIAVELSLPESNKFKHGLNGEVNFQINSKRGVLAVPKAAVRKNNGSPYVYTLEKGKVLKKDIVIGESLGGQTEVITGVSEGDKVILGDVK